MQTNPSTPPQIDLNQADQETLTTLPGIGPALAARIIRFREEAHPFEEAIDIIAVPGISQKMYHQFADRITVSPPGQVISGALPQIDAAPDDQAPEIETEAIPTEMEEVQEMPPENEDKPTLPPIENPPAPPMAAPQPRGGGAWRLWLAAIVAAIGGALLALLVLQSINGTLNMADHPEVLRLSNQVSNLERQSETLNGEISELRDRLNQMEALSGRLQEAEAEIETLSDSLVELNEQLTTLEQDLQQVQADVQTLNEGLSTHGEQIATLEQNTVQLQETVSEIEAAADRFDNFLNGLRDLLLVTEEATVTPPVSASPTPTERVEPTDTPPALPATPAGTPTRTPRPTRTPTPTPTANGL
jgi:DNA uptake protein ComE-like DNA-binding protein